MALAFPAWTARNGRTMKLRVIFGAVMIVVLSGLLWCEGELLEETDWRGVPLAAVMAALGMAACGELSGESGDGPCVQDPSTDAGTNSALHTLHINAVALINNVWGNGGKLSLPR